MDAAANTLDDWYLPFRQNTIGHDLLVETYNGRTPLVYADWTASGRLYQPIETYLSEELGPWVGNTHTESTWTGCAMSAAYDEARSLIKHHVGADQNDVLLFCGNGMTSAINKLQRILGLRGPEQWQQYLPDKRQKPLVCITHMEHHSNQTTWEECDVDIAIIERGEDGKPSLQHLEDILQSEHQNRPLLIGSFTACSNVTGIETDYHRMAALMHKYGGICFVDFAASAPYVSINMHPANLDERLDGIFFSPHKFLGGPGSSGVLVFHSRLYRLSTPDQPGGGTVAWTNPWGGHRYYDNIEIREDGGTPGFLQAIKAALAVRLKEAMGIERIRARERHLASLFVRELTRHPDIELLEGQQQERLPIFSFYSRHIHHNLLVKILNDYFGIQVRGGCSCAGTYGHILLGVDQERSQQITAQIDAGDLSSKPGWVRVSLHPTMTEDEVLMIARAIHQVIDNIVEWSRPYRFDSATGEFYQTCELQILPSLSAARLY
ncbi:MAG: aminotransferase class V-fold PLP-dependent enzyme [Gammaproteobacteria bacterium]|nr:MAG: aminotransferase class V-fold PLP-dependent enzyme [Gammaproteobacteria bacterium]